jgi:hypothetical protein
VYPASELQVSRGSANVAPLWSPLDDEIFYVDHRGMLMAAPVRTTPGVALGPPQPLFAPRGNVDWVGQENGVHFLVMELARGEPQLLANPNRLATW